MKKTRSGWRQPQAGVTFIESVVALAVLGVIAVGLLSGLNTATRASVSARDRATAESLARSQMEYVKDRPYNPGAGEYMLDPHINVPAEWAVPDSTVDSLHDPDDGLQKVTVTVQHHGVTVLVIEDYKVNR